MRHTLLSWLTATALIAASSLFSHPAHAQGNTVLPEAEIHGYLFAHRSAHGGWPAFATSPDGVHFHDMLCGDSIFSTDDKGEYGNVSYVYICRTHEGDGYILLTTNADGSVCVQLSSDLISWTEVQELALRGVRSARMVWDQASGSYLLYYAEKERGRLLGNRLSIMSSSLDPVPVVSLSDSEILADWDVEILDAELECIEDGSVVLLAKVDDRSAGFLRASTSNLRGPWTKPSESFVIEDDDYCREISAFKVADQKGWSFGYVNTTKGGYRLCQSDDAMDRFFAPKNIEGIYGPDAGSFLALNEEEYQRIQAWADAEEAKHLAPNVKNPVFPGLHADPEVLYSIQTGKYYIYPTTDGAYAWHSYDFHCFSSEDLVNWKDEGVILDLRDLEWGDREYAWAPCIIEKPVFGGFKYYFYFVHHGTIGVAVADQPEGPFKDVLGKALLTQEEIHAPNQIIDPDVFRDRATGKYYLYWGNSYLWMAELAPDMISLVPGTMHELIPRSKIGEYHYLEGTYVFERKGLYYFMWSENITRSSYYRVRYLISDSPTEFVRNGRPAKVEDTIVIQQDPSKQIFGTGHHSVICKPGTDEWYIVYHRFNRPGGVKLGLSGGYNREICIDRLEFNEDGTIKPVIPSL
ncbi:MAG: family 43 glycosylhydrolase [Bacteroidales bacterium]|nr:family 43 glycosylhydrolase [Bacteroidales bacterium]